MITKRNLPQKGSCICGFEQGSGEATEPLWEIVAEGQEGTHQPWLVHILHKVTDFRLKLIHGLQIKKTSKL